LYSSLDPTHINSHGNGQAKSHIICSQVSSEKSYRYITVVY